MPIVNGPDNPAIVYPVIINELLSGSESLFSALPFKGVSSFTTRISSVVNGTSLTGVTVIPNVPVLVPPLPSLTV